MKAKENVYSQIPPGGSLPAVSGAQNGSNEIDCPFINSGSGV